MDERARLFLWLLLSCGFFSLLAGAFGAVAGWVTGRDGRGAGTFVGLSVARAFARLRDEPLSAATNGSLVGGVDGVVFGLAFGMVVGLLTGGHGGDWRVLGPVMLGGVLLVGGALALGVLAYAIGGGGARSVLGLFLGGAVGAGLGMWLGRTDGLLAGALVGVAAGVIASRVRR